MKNRLLTPVDMQNDFMLPTGALPVTKAEGIIEPSNRFLRDQAKKFTGVMPTFDTHDPVTYPQSPEAELFPIHCVKGTWGWELAVKLGKDTMLEKDVFDMWAKGTPELLRFVRPSEWEIYVMGVAGDYCVNDAVAGFLNRGFTTTVIADLTKGINAEFEDVAKDKFAEHLKNDTLRLITANEFARRVR